MDAFGVLDKVLADYESFVAGFLNIQDDRVRQKVEAEIDNGLVVNLKPAVNDGLPQVHLKNATGFDPHFHVRLEDGQRWRYTPKQILDSFYRVEFSSFHA